MPTGFNRILIGVVFFGLCIGASFGAGTVWGRFTAPKAAAAVATTTGATGARTGATGGAAGTNGALGTSGASGGRGAFGSSGAAGVDGTPAAGNGFARRPGIVTGVSGTVESVSGQTLTISTSGTTQTPETVTLGSNTQVGSVTKGDASTLRAGDTVLVTGQRGTDGSLTATSVMVLPQGFLQP